MEFYHSGVYFCYLKCCTCVFGKPNNCCLGSCLSSFFFHCGCAEVFPRVRFASATAPSGSSVRIDNSTVVRPKTSCLAANVPGQSRSQCSTVSLASSHLGQEKLSAGFIRVLYPATSMLCPERSLASMTASLLDRRVFSSRSLDSFW